MPSLQALGMSEFVSAVTGRDRASMIEANRCINCTGRADFFESEISKEEFKITGLCQTCQATICD